MPEVDLPRDIDKVFEQARSAASNENVTGGVSNRQVVFVTPGRVLMLQPCPPAGSMPKKVVTEIEKLVSSKVKRKIAVIGYTEMKAVSAGLIKAIPFFGMLVGMAYVGHSVWIFEGHVSALSAGCKEADVLIVDSGMAPHLPKDWQKLAASGAPSIQIYVHDRAQQALQKVN